MDKSGQNILILAKLNEVCGNSSTATRIKCHLAKVGFHCILQDVGSTECVDALLQQHQISAILALHAYHSGKILTNSRLNIPYAVVLGGTDVNEYHRDTDKMKIMSSVLKHSKYIIGFSKQMVNTAARLWKNIDAGIFISIPQAVETYPSDFSLPEYLKAHNHIPAELSAQDLDIFLLIGGIRSVKDPLYLTDIFSEWHREHRTCFFVIIGPKIEDCYYEKFLKKIQTLPGVVYINGLIPSDTHASIEQSCAVVNSSLSEGMSTAILEAMQLGTPVIARNIPGNSAILQDGKSALLYNTPQEFLEKAKLLLCDPTLYNEIVIAAKQSIETCHNLEEEGRSYTMVVHDLLSKIHH
ncbi:Hypothetical predicted protein [Octopus vulgaris]|uniref:Glycosyl transferase family 1 domain-containing protein n=1 Tax=Octopus vulgaris TaxID=6645 RepID=A0AA36BTS5_OCTVU|nr:Hypothetical predicted protein [Octopus vulgaris]